jgi:hypothetical protein
MAWYMTSDREPIAFEPAKLQDGAVPDCNSLRDSDFEMIFRQAYSCIRIDLHCSIFCRNRENCRWTNLRSAIWFCRRGLLRDHDVGAF